MGKMRMQVFICTLGQKGADLIAEKDYPRLPGVEYVVTIQEPDVEVVIPDKITLRPDFSVIRTKTRGIAVNRNIALDAATASIALITDDDVVFQADELLGLMRAFDERPETDIISFRYQSRNYPKTYPDFEFEWKRIPKNYHMTAIEVAMRPERLRGRLRYNERFGFSTDFLGGEDDMLLFEAVKKGIAGRFIPMDVGRHDHASSRNRFYGDERLLETKGALISYVSPVIWFPRMLAHVFRHAGRGKEFGRMQYLRALLRGRRRFLKG